MQARICDHCKKAGEEMEFYIHPASAYAKKDQPIDICSLDCLAQYAISKGGHAKGTILTKAAKWVGVE